MLVKVRFASWDTKLSEETENIARSVFDINKDISLWLLIELRMNSKLFVHTMDFFFSIFIQVFLLHRYAINDGKNNELNNGYKSDFCRIF